MRPVFRCSFQRRVPCVFGAAPLTSRVIISPFTSSLQHSRCFSLYARFPDEDDSIEREEMEFDVVVVGGGPAGLSTAIHLRHQARRKGISDDQLSIAVLDKGSEIGSHIISGNVFNPVALDELMSGKHNSSSDSSSSTNNNNTSYDWRDDPDNPLTANPVKNDQLWYLTETQRLSVPHWLLPKHLRNDNHYVASLSNVCRWLGEYAENDCDVMILPGFSVDRPIFSDNERKHEVIGVYTSDMGQPGHSNFEPGSKILAKQTVLCEGCRGSVSENVMKHFHMRGSSEQQMYAIGFKEIWEVSDQIPIDKLNQILDECGLVPGTVVHSLGWPVADTTYGGGFIYTTHDDPMKLYIGIAISLEYENPYFNPYKEFQRFKTHPFIQDVLINKLNAQCISYGARALNEGGYQSIPESVSFPGGMITGCSLGLVNIAKVKGTHYAMKSGMIAAESILDTIRINNSDDTISMPEYGSRLVNYDKSLKNSWIYDDLKAVRNIKPSFNFGKWMGLLHSALSTSVTFGYEPWTLSHGKENCAERTLKITNDNHNQNAKCRSSESLLKEVSYYDKLKYDNQLTFDILTNLQRTNTYHDDSEPSHLKVKVGMDEYANGKSYFEYGGPESRFCPAQVYEFDESGKLIINSQNCIHCKTCSIKSPNEYIDWTVPVGGGGPKYEST